MNSCTPVFTAETAPVDFETSIQISDFCFDIRITEKAPFNSLDCFAEECFRQIIECAVRDGLLKSEFTPLICMLMTKAVIKNYKKLTDLASIDEATVLTQELVMFPEYYANVLMTKDHIQPITFFTEKRLELECKEMFRQSFLKESKSYSTTFTVSYEFSITVEGTDQDKLSDLVDSTASDVASQLKDIIKHKYRDIHTDDDVAEVRYCDYDINCDQLEED